MLATLTTFLITATEKGPEPEDVVAGWTAFGLFGLGILAIAVLGFSLTKRLKNVEKAREQGLYDPSDPKPDRPARGLAAARQMREDAAADDAERGDDGPARPTP